MFVAGCVVIGIIVGLALSPWLMIYSLLVRTEIKPMPDEKDLIQMVVGKLIEYWDTIMAIGVAFIGSVLSHLQRMREGKVGRTLVDAGIEIGSGWFFASLAFGFAMAIGLNVGAALAITGYCAFKGVKWTSGVFDNLIKNRMQ